jgi:molybdenum-dependent DNA-binding transcriptional regulator ModE
MELKMSVKLVTGNKKKSYPSIRAASEATGIPYITLWKRVNELGWSISKAVNADVRKYDRKRIAA